MQVSVPVVANDVVPRMMRTPSDAEIRDIVRLRTMAIVAFFYHPSVRGDVRRYPFEWIDRYLALDTDTQREIVLAVSRLSPDEVDALEPAALRAACGETVDYLRCVLSDEKLIAIIRDEVGMLLPGAFEESH